jgi:hypothetical protein
MDNEALLTQLLLDMDIPPLRRRIDSLTNVRWLLSNLGFRNSRHRSYRRAIELLKGIYKESLKQQPEQN